MAAKDTKIETQQRRLKLKAEQLNLRLQIQERKAKHAEVSRQLKAIGGRIR